jgi:hypothetical protein
MWSGPGSRPLEATPDPRFLSPQPHVRSTTTTRWSNRACLGELEEARQALPGLPAHGHGSQGGKTVDTEDQARLLTAQMLLELSSGTWTARQRAKLPLAQWDAERWQV